MVKAKRVRSRGCHNLEVVGLSLGLAGQNSKLGHHGVVWCWRLVSSDRCPEGRLISKKGQDSRFLPEISKRL